MDRATLSAEKNKTMKLFFVILTCAAFFMSTSSMENERAEKVFGIFVGRTPCRELVKQLQIQTPDCMKLKWKLTLYQDASGKPSTYHLARTGHRQSLIEGKWVIIKGTPSDAEAIIYQLDPGMPDRSLLLLKGDENVLFFLDHSRNLLVGNEEFSYTLNRTDK